VATQSFKHQDTGRGALRSSSSSRRRCTGTGTVEDEPPLLKMSKSFSRLFALSDRASDVKPTKILTTLFLVYSIVRRLPRSPPGNPVYIPPILQHYAFERLNDRCSKDQQAYSVMVEDMNGSQVASKKVIITEHRYNGTIVVMYWTKLDISVSRLDVLRDEVPFLIDCYQERDETKDRNVGNENNFDVIVLLESPGGSPSEYSLLSNSFFYGTKASTLPFALTKLPPRVAI
jgi:hypothetical protein